ncbi:MAG: NADH-quinone oxidoreductase subunit N [Armatimonadetes bacterium]|nr:NADH-quinone oxidoreductase subunit N [Armatimonadota bacterium]
MLFVGLETMSIALYILSGIAGGREPGSNEAALKYLLLGAFATGFLVYGMAFVFGATGSLDLRVLHDLALHRATIPGFLNVGLALLIIGLGFKVALVPFHMWAPDVYEGAPTPITAFMSVGAKVAGFAALIRVLSEAALPVQEVWLPGLWWLAVATMLIGNVIALVQTSIKRLLAYSSIAHAGYLTIGIVAGTRLGVEAVVYYSLAYALMNLGAFAVVLAANGDHDRLQLYDLRGLARRSPLLAGAMALFMFSLAGVPPLSGFIGKWLLFSAAVEANQVGLAVLAVLCSAISAFYYLRVVVYMYMTEPAETHRPLLDTPRTRTALYATIVGTVLLSFPAGLLFVHLSGWAAWQG